MSKSTKNFMLVDDDIFCNLLTKKSIEIIINGAEVKDFVSPELALNFIETEFENKHSEEKTMLFLDINMPTLTAWEFLDEFEKFEASLKKQFKIYILSSSIDPAEIQRAKLHPDVIDFIEKPINKNFLLNMFSEQIGSN